LPLPVGKTDFERTIKRLPGLKLLSFSSKEDGNDALITAKLAFDSMETLLGFLGTGGAFSSENGQNRLRLSLPGGGGETDGAFSKNFEAYTVKIGLAPPGEGVLEVSAALPGAVTETKGKKLSYSAPISALLSASGVDLIFTWH